MGKLFAGGLVLLLLSSGAFGAAVSGGDKLAVGQFDSTRSFGDSVGDVDHPLHSFQHISFQAADKDDDKEDDDDDEDEDEREEKEDDDDDDEDEDEREEEEDDDDDDEDEDEREEEEDDDDDDEDEDEREEEEDDDDDDEDEDTEERGEDDEDVREEEGDDEEEDGGETVATAPQTPNPTASPARTAGPSPAPTATPDSAGAVAPSTTSTPSAARFDVVTATLNETRLVAGASAGIAVQVENAGERGGTFPATLTVDSEPVHAKSITVGPGGTETAVFEHQFEDPGEYEIAVAGASLGAVTVTAPAGDGTKRARLTDDGDRTGAIEVIDATIPADWVKSGYETAVRATVENTADQRGTRTLTVKVDGRPVAVETVTLEPYETDVVAIGAKIRFETAGGTVAVEGVDAGRITVSESDEGVQTEPEGIEADAGGGIGAGIPVLVVVILIPAGVAAVFRWI